MAVLGSLGDLVLALSADTAKFQSDLGRADRLAKKFSREVGQALGTLAAGFLTLAGAAGIGGLIKSQIDAADEANKMSQKLGIATETLSEYFFAAKLANVSNQQLQVGLQQLAKNQADFVIGTGEAKYAFDALGISQEQVKALNGDNAKLFELVAGKLAGFADGGNKTAIAMKILGKSGAELIPLINSLESARKEAHELNAIIDKPTAMAAEQFNDNLTRMGIVVQAMGLSIAKHLLPGMKDATDRMVEGAKSGEPWLAFLKEELRIVLKLSEALPSIGPLARIAGLALNASTQSVRGFQAEVRALDNLLQEKPDAPKLRDLAKEAKEAETRLKAFHDYAKRAGEELQNFEEAGLEVARQQYAEVERLAEARANSMAEWATEQEEVAQLTSDLADTTSRVESGARVAERAARDFGFTFNSALEDAIINGEDLSNVVKALEKDIARMILRQTVTQPLGDAVSGIIGKGIAGMFGGGFSLAEEASMLGVPGRAMGGPFSGAAVVGERGPELVVGSGTVVPNHALGGNTFIVDMRGASMEAVQRLEGFVASINGSLERRALAAVDSRQSRRGDSRIG